LGAASAAWLAAGLHHPRRPRRPSHLFYDCDRSLRGDVCYYWSPHLPLGAAASLLVAPAPYHPPPPLLPLLLPPVAAAALIAPPLGPDFVVESHV